MCICFSIHLSINNWNNVVAQKTKITYLSGRLCVLMNKVKTCLSRIFFLKAYIYIIVKIQSCIVVELQKTDDENPEYDLRSSSANIALFTKKYARPLLQLLCKPQLNTTLRKTWLSLCFHHFFFLFVNLLLLLSFFLFCHSSTTHTLPLSLSHPYYLSPLLFFVSGN